jgi:hypothetical protein
MSYIFKAQKFFQKQILCWDQTLTASLHVTFLDQLNIYPSNINTIP